MMEGRKEPRKLLHKKIEVVFLKFFINCTCFSLKIFFLGALLVRSRDEPQSPLSINSQSKRRSKATTHTHTLRQPQISNQNRTQEVHTRDFLGAPVVKTLPSNAEDEGSIPGQGAKTPHASQKKNQNIKQKQYCNKFNKYFKNGPH